MEMGNRTKRSRNITITGCVAAVDVIGESFICGTYINSLDIVSPALPTSGGNGGFVARVNVSGTVVWAVPIVCAVSNVGQRSGWRR